MLSAKEIGKLGEDIAVKFLRKKRYKILDRNFQKDIEGLKFGEIDIIAKKDGVIVFVEVKSLKQRGLPAMLPARGGLQAGGIEPEERVDFRKRETIRKISEIWLDQRKIPLDSPWQIDILAIVLDFNSHKAKIRHFKNI